jgi:hypothetical protein
MSMQNGAFERRQVEVPGAGIVSAVWGVPGGLEPGVTPALVLAHGAGNDMENPLLVTVQEHLVERGLLAVRFNFPYTEAGRKAPDPPRRLEATWKAMLDAVRAAPEGPSAVFAGGKSMGGRIASQMAADGLEVAGLVFLGYPLHPARKPEKERSAHLPRIPCPMLFVQGDRDPLCDLGRLREVLADLPAPVTLHVVEGGDHSFKVPKRMGRGEGEILQEVAGWVGDWLSGAARR